MTDSATITKEEVVTKISEPVTTTNPVITTPPNAPPVVQKGNGKKSCFVCCIVVLLVVVGVLLGTVFFFDKIKAYLVDQVLYQLSARSDANEIVPEVKTDIDYALLTKDIERVNESVKASETISVSQDEINSLLATQLTTSEQLKNIDFRVGFEAGIVNIFFRYKDKASPWIKAVFLTDKTDSLKFQNLSISGITLDEATVNQLSSLGGVNASAFDMAQINEALLNSLFGENNNWKISSIEAKEGSLLLNLSRK